MTIPDERAAFEAWFKAERPASGLYVCVYARRAGQYAEPHTQTAWLAWQARAALDGKPATRLNALRQALNIVRYETGPGEFQEAIDRAIVGLGK